MGDVEQSAGMVMPGGRAKKWGQGRPPGGWRYRHHFRNKTKKRSPPPPAVLGVGGALLTVQAHRSLAVQGRQAWGPLVEGPTSSAH